MAIDLKQRQMQTISAVLDEEAVLAGGGENDLGGGSGRVVGVLEGSGTAVGATGARGNGDGAGGERPQT